MTRFLHVANGTSTTMTIEAAGIPGLRSIWADPLHEGPVPAVSDADLIEVRRRYLAGSAGAVDPVNDMREWRAVIARHDAYDELVLWFEHDLFDQLNLIQVLSWIREQGPGTIPVSLICIDSFPGRPDFKGLGELTPGELAPLLETRRPVSDRQYALALRAWHAFRAPTPEPLDALRRENTSALPFLAAAIVRFLQEYPWTTDGLSRTERRLLQLAAAAELSLSSAFRRLGEGERVYHVTDLSLQSLADNLAHAAPPLLTLSPASHAAGHASFHRLVVATDAGRRVLAGERDRVATCGIDRWLGGVHLHGRSVPWRWDEGAQTIATAAV